VVYQILSLKWRPKTFSEVVGQDHIVVTLSKAFKSGQIAQGFMFTGPRGVGKTTTARIVAKALNCKKQPGIGCSDCSNCMEISESRNMDVLEIDGASHRGIDEIRNIRDIIKYSPMNSKYKVVIIDEVHMLTTQAFNALLKTLEEPPSHGKFILATTDIQKVPMTIISRCQRYDFHRLSVEIIAKKLNEILNSESIQADPQAIHSIAVKATGSMRDALSTLEQIIAYSGKKITYDDTMKVLGLISSDLFFSLMRSLKEKDLLSMMNDVKCIQNSGVPPMDFINGLNEHIRNLMLSSSKSRIDLLTVNNELKNQYFKEGKQWDIRDLLRISDILDDLIVKLKYSTHPDILIEMTFIKLLEMDTSIQLEDLIHRLYSIKHSKFRLNKPPNENESTTPKINRGRVVKAEQNVVKSETKMYDDEIKKNDIDRNTRNLEKNPDSPLKKEKINGKNIISDSSVTENQSDNNQNGQSKLSLELIQTKWSEFVTYIGSHKPSIGSILNHCNPSELNEDEVCICLHNQPKFNFTVLERNKPWISQSLGKIISQSINIKFFFDENSKVLGTNKERNSKKNHNKNDESLISKIIEKFDGELIN
jgi:DNA polymerase-3 subunit gamma/tau